MAKKPRRRRGSLRAATKVQERGLQATAEVLLEKPDVVVPRCEGHRSHFKREDKAVRKAWAARDDEKKLGGLARRAPPIARAYAATLLVGLGEQAKTIMMQVPTPFGKVPVASRGKARTSNLVGVQYHDDAKLRLLGVFPLVKSKGLHFYSMPDGGIVCTGKEPKPPKGFVQAEAEVQSLRTDPEGYACPHAMHAEERITIHWLRAGVKLRKCAACAREGNTLLGIVRHIAAKDVLSGFHVEVELPPLPSQGSAPVDLPQAPLDAAALERYKKGELDDAGLLEAQRASRFAHWRTLPGPLYVHGSVNYGKDLDAFLQALNPSPVEAQALRGALQGQDRTVVMERGSAAKVLGDLWQERGLAALEALTGNADVAREVFEAHDAAAKGVGPALQRAQARADRSATEAALPSYQALPPGPALADRVAREHRAHGRAAALAVLEAQDTPELRGAAHALERALGAGQAQAWRYTPMDLELALQLEPHAKALLEAPPEQYHEALSAFAKAMGVAQELRPARGAGGAGPRPKG